MNGFNFETKKSILTDLINISNNYSVLHFDEFPILFYGTNRFNNKIIGSHLDEDDDAQNLYAMHVLVNNKQFSEFISGKKSYRALLEDNDNVISIVKKSFDNRILDAFDFKFEDIPPEYLPSQNSYCPKSKTKRSLQFSLSMQGRLADVNRAVTDVVSAIQDGFKDFVESRIKALKELELTSQALLVPYAEGSFRINFEVKIEKKPQQLRLFAQDAPLENFLTQYIEYLTNDFNSDTQAYIDNLEPASNGFESLLETYSQLFNAVVVAPPLDIQNSLKEDIIKSLPAFEEITGQIGNEFEGLEFINGSSDAERTIGYADQIFANDFRESFEKIEASRNEVEVDEDSKNYEISIYHLNTDTRSGNAWIKNPANPEEMARPKIKINGDSVLEETKYTESLHTNKWIEVSAKAKRVNGRFVYLTIDF